MRKTNLFKLIAILLMSTMIMFVNASVFAATEDEEEEVTDLTTTINNTNKSNTNSNSSNSNTNRSNTNTNSNNVNRNSNNTSVYNNTNLPKTGIEDSIPIAMLVVVFGISAVYAYKKVTYYRNI